MDKLQDSPFFGWQGGGVGIWGQSEVTFTSCNIYENTAYAVRNPDSVHRPHGQMLTTVRAFVRAQGVSPACYS